MLSGGKGVMGLIFEVKRFDLKMVECESLWSVLHRWLAKLRRLIRKEKRG